MDKKLTWAPPAGWESFEEVTMPPEGGTIELQSGRNYRLMALSTIRAPVHIRGGRKRVWIGGHIRIDDAPLKGAESSP